VARLPVPADVLAARSRIAGSAVRTPLEPSPVLAREIGAAEVRLKLESAQPVGSFKIRGATNKVAALAEAGEQGPLVTASTGNHGIAVAHAAARYGLPVTILVGAGVSTAKLERLRALESEQCVVEIFGRDSDDVEREARRRDQAGQARYVSPYNDADVVAGQATVGMELLEDWPDCDTMVVPVGGGGLIGGIGLWAKTLKPRLRLVGVQPAASPPMYAYLETGSTAPMPIGPTLADGVAGNIERGSITFKLCRRYVDAMVLVDEEEIANAMRWAFREHDLLLEGSAVLGIAALRARRVAELAVRHIGVVVTGRNVDADVARDVLKSPFP
jgi:threonine dehydratase